MAKFNIKKPGTVPGEIERALRALLVNVAREGPYFYIDPVDVGRLQWLLGKDFTKEALLAVGFRPVGGRRWETPVDEGVPHPRFARFEPPWRLIYPIAGHFGGLVRPSRAA